MNFYEIIQDYFEKKKQQEKRAKEVAGGAMKKYGCTKTDIKYSKKKKSANDPKCANIYWAIKHTMLGTRKNK